jgi:hypothetical protein
VDGKITAMETQKGDSGAAVIPVHGMLLGVPIENSTTYYRIETEKMIYVITPKKNVLLNVTINRKTKIASDSKNVYLLDDAGKEQKVYIVQKIAKPAGLKEVFP